MQFIYPRSRQFPFDESCEKIVHALHARDWKVPGLVVKFRDYGSGAQKLRYVSEVRSDQSAIDLGQHDVRIVFGRPQGLLPGGRWNDVAAACEVRVGKRCLRVFQDESGPTLDVYVGADWETDRSTWWSRPNARLDNKPRLCVRYTGRNRRQCLRAEDLGWNKDDREYGPESAEPWAFRTSDVMDDVRGYLRSVVFPAIEACPVAEVVSPVCADPLPIPMPAVGPFFAYGTGRDAERIALGKSNVADLELAEQYALSGSLRLAWLNLKPGIDLPEVAFEGFLWCGTSPTIPGGYPRWSEDVLIKVVPKDARGIYVADHAAYVKRRAEIAETIDERFSDADVLDFIRARACTIVSILDYANNYEDPVYLINRELGFDEVEVIGKRPA